MFRLRSIILCGMALLLVACQSDEWDGGRTGGIRVTLAETSVNVETKATPGEIVAELGGNDKLKSRFDLRIVNSETGKDAYSGKYTDQTINVSPGTYRVIASYGKNEELAWDEPYFYGKSETVEVKENATEAASATVQCKVANAFLEMRFNPTGDKSDPAVFDKLFKEYGIDIKGRSATYHFTNKMQEEGKNPYLKAESNLTFTFVGKWKAGEDSEEDYKQPINIGVIEGGYKYTVNLTMASTQGGALNITVDKKETTITDNIPLEWLPKPKIEAVGFAGNTLYVAEGATVEREAKLAITVAQPLQDLSFTLDMGEGDALSGDYKLSTIDEAQRTALKEAGIVLPQIGDKSPVIDFTGLTANKLSSNNGTTVKKTITKLIATANNRLSDGANYDIDIIPLKYNVKVYPGNKWTKEFTATSTYESGSEEAYNSATIQYEYSADGGQTWLPATSNATVTGLTPGTTYKVRANCLGVLAEAETTTYPIVELENGKLEKSTISEGDDNSITGGAVYEWQGWATLNKISTPTGGTCYSFNSRSGCRPTDDSQEGKAIRIITLGYGIGGWAKPQKAMHSQLYLGTSADREGNGIANGIAFSSRPTHLNFWYKCISNKGNDQSLAKIQILHDNTILGEGFFVTSATVGSNYQNKKLEIVYNNDISSLSLNPNKIVVLFQSGTKDPITIDDLKSFLKFSWNTVDKTADATFRGNELFIDDISLIYDK